MWFSLQKAKYSMDELQGRSRQNYFMELWTREISHFALISVIFLIPFAVSIVAGRPFMVAATLAYWCIVLGISARKSDRRRHLSLMSVGIALDIGIVLTLEVQRHAIDTAVQMSLNPLQQAHILFSSFAVLMYMPLVALGVLHFFGRAITVSSRWHRRLGTAAFAFRTAGFILMFTLLTKIQ